MTNFTEALKATEEIVQLTMKLSDDSYAAVSGRLMALIPYIINEEDPDVRLRILTARVEYLKEQLNEN